MEASRSRSASGDSLGAGGAGTSCAGAAGEGAGAGAVGRETTWGCWTRKAVGTTTAEDKEAAHGHAEVASCEGVGGSVHGTMAARKGVGGLLAEEVVVVVEDHW